MLIKSLTSDLFDETILLMEQYVYESQIKEIDDTYLIETIRRGAISPSGIWLNAYVGNTLVGFVAGNIGNETMINKKIAFMNYLYIVPEHRELENYQSLVWKFFEKAKEFQAIEVIVTANEIEQQNQILTNELAFNTKNIFVRSI